MRLLPLVAASTCLVLLAGCVDPMLADDPAPGSSVMPTWTRDGCDPGDAQPSGNMPATAPFDGSADDLIARFEQAFDVDVPEEPSHTYGGSSTYELEQGTFRINLVEDLPDADRRVPFAEWVHPTAWPGPTSGAAARFAQGLADLGYPDVMVEGPNGSTVKSMAAHQVTKAGGQLVADALFHPTRYDESGWYSSLTLYPAYADTGAAQVSAQRARNVAADFLACKDGRDEFPEGPFQAAVEARKAVLFESLAWEMVYHGARDPNHHCGGVGAYIHVDAQTEAVLRWSWLPCD